MLSARFRQIGSAQLGLLSALLALASGCAQDLPDIDRVQPNVTKKADLLGREWYLRTTTVETQTTGASTFPGEMSSLVRGVFEVQERALYFYRTYEFIEGSEAYAQRSDVDTPMIGKDGKPVYWAVPEDYQQIRCTADEQATQCGKDAWCASAQSPKLAGEEDWAGYCVRKSTRYVFRGAPVLAYPISSHFDITRTYSAATGEESNVIVENTTDRHWYDRSYMRVGWGNQQIMSFDADVSVGATLASGGPGTAPVIYEGDNAPAGEGFETGQSKLHDSEPQRWFTFTHRVIAAAQQTFLEGFGAIPICYFYPWYAGGVFDCSSEEIRIRTFFLEVPKFEKEPERAYVARDTNDVEFEKFGYFRTERASYDTQYGNTFAGAIKRVNRHRIWDKYVKCYVNPADAQNADGSPKCQPKSASTVWKGEFDYSKMTPVPIVYYLNDDHPRELVQASIDIGKEWSEPLVETVAFHKGAAPGHPMFIVCENSDAAAKAAIAAGQTVAEWSGSDVGKRFCKDMDKPHRFGDLRYSFMHAVPQPIQAGLYGYGPSAADPITGEIIAASAHSYAGVMKSGAEAALQGIELLAGVKDFNEIAGANEKVVLMEGKALATAGQPGFGSVADVQAAVSSLMDPEVRQRLENVGLERTDNASTWAQSRLATIQEHKELDAMLVGDDEGHSMRLLHRDPSAFTAAKAPQALTSQQLQAYSLAAWNHTAARKARQDKLRVLGEKTIHFADFADNAILGLANEYGRQYDEALCKAMAQPGGHLFDGWFADPANFVSEAGAVQICPAGSADGDFVSKGVGKGVLCKQNTYQLPDTTTANGLVQVNCSTQVLMNALRVAVHRANGGSPLAETYRFLPSALYGSSTDAVVQKTQKLALGIVLPLRDKLKLVLWERIYKGTQEHEVGHTLGLRHNFEASTDALNYHEKYWDLKLKPGSNEVANPLQQDTEAQALAGIREQQLASVMDYTSKFNGRFASLGHYDRAAIKFGYGDLVEAFNQIQPADLTTDPDGAGPLAPATAYLATPTAQNPSLTTVQFLGNQLGVRLNRRLHYSVLPQYFKGKAGMYDRKNVRWSELRGDACSADSDCSGGKVCAPFGEAKFCANPAVVEVPYRFCSDEWNGQTPTCATFDEGVDAYEITRNALDDYENYWFFWGYSRDSETFHPDNYAARVERQFWTATRQFQFWAVDFATFQKDGWWKNQFGIDYDLDPNGGLSGAYATMLGFNTMAQALGRPTCGWYGRNNQRLRFEPYTDLDNTTFADIRRIIEPQGCRTLYPGWDYNGYTPRPASGGQVYDRLAAYAMLSDPTMVSLVGVNENEDIRRYLVSYHTFFPRQVTNLFAGIAVEEAKHFGWYIVQGKDPNVDELARRTWLGPGSEQTPKRCEDFPTDATAEQKIGCVKYDVFPDARPVFPSSRFRMPLQASYYGMALLSRGYNRSYLDLSRVFLKGNQAKIDLPADLAPEDVAEFADPLSGKVYIAARVDKDMLNPGFLAVQAAKAELAKFKNLEALQDSYLFSDYQFRVSLLDLMRTMHEVYEY